MTNTRCELVLLVADDAPPICPLPLPPLLPLVPLLLAFDFTIRSDSAATSTMEFMVENLFIFILPGPIIVGACLSISTSHILLGLGTTIPPIVEAMAWQFRLRPAAAVPCPPPEEDDDAVVLV